MKATELRSFEKGMDLDSSPLLLENGRYRRAFNIYNGNVDEADLGTIVPELGNTAVNDTLPAGTNRVIGYTEDIENDAMIFFVYNSEGQHSIRRVLSSQPSVQVIYQGEILNFQKDQKIRGADVIEGLLYWTDGYFETYTVSNGLFGFNPPRKINIDKAIDNGYTVVDFQTLDRIKYPPFRAPTAKYISDSTKSSNFMYRNLFQFRYRYIYDDYERSVWSEISSTPIPQNIEKIENRNGVDPFLDNTILVKVNTGHSTVVRIEIASRIGDFRPFGIFKTLDKVEDGLGDFEEIEVEYTNNESRRILSQEENGKNYDRVPQVSKDQELISGNRLVDANIIEGYSSVPLCREATQEEIDNGLDFITPGQMCSNAKWKRRILDSTTTNVVFFASGLPAGTNDAILVVPDPTTVFIGDTFVFVVGGAEFSFTITEQPTTQLELQLMLVEYLQVFFPGTGGAPLLYLFNAGYQWQYLASYGIIGDDDSILINFPNEYGQDNPLSAVFIIPVGDAFVRAKSLKTGTVHPVGIVYEDRGGRPGSVNTNDNMSVYVPFHSEPGGAQGLQYSDRARVYDLDLTIQHTPPVWANRYRIVMRKNTRILSFGQWSVRFSEVGDNGKLKIYLSFNPTYQQADGDIAAIKHEILVGDVIRFITVGWPVEQDEYFLNEYAEASIIQWFPGENAVEIDFSGSLPNLMESLISSSGSLIEIYTPRKSVDEADDFWYEIGQTHPILNPHTEYRRHGVTEEIVDFSVISQEGDPEFLNMVIRTGDVYIRRRLMYEYLSPGGGSSTTRDYWVEDPHFSDYYESNWHDWGRLHTLDPDARRLELKTAMRFSDIYIQNTSYNGLSSFDEPNFEDVMDKDGPITRIMEVGYVLKVLQPQKITSIYLNRTVLFNSDGTSNVSASNSVLGTKNPSETEFGCVHPDSVVKSERSLYFFDAMNGCVVRDSANGQIAISKLGVSRYIYDLAKVFRTLTNAYVIGGFDRAYGRVTMSFYHDGDQRPNPSTETISFDEDSNQWTSFHSWIPEMVGRRGDRFYTFKDGRVYLHNSNDIRGEFYGEKFKPIVSVVFNQDPTKVKIADAITIESDDIWSADNDGDFSSLASHQQQGGSTRIKKGRFKKKEGGFYSDIPMDLNTPIVDNPIVNGRRVRGRCFIAELSNDSESKVYLLGARLNYTNSERSGS